MKRTLAIAVLLASLGLAAASDGAAARDCGACGRISPLHVAQMRDDEDGRGFRRPFLRTPRDDGYYGSRLGSRREDWRRAYPDSERGPALSDTRIWAIAKARVPGRIVNVRLHGPVYYFRIISQRGSIVDVAVHRYSGRVVSVRGGP